MEIYIKDIIKLCDGKLLSGDENIVINNIFKLFFIIILFYLF